MYWCRVARILMCGKVNNLMTTLTTRSLVFTLVFCGHSLIDKKLSILMTISICVLTFEGHLNDHLVIRCIPGFIQ